MANSYLDKVGLERLWAHIVALVNGAAAGDGEGNIIADTYLKLSGGTVTGEVKSSTAVAPANAAFRNIKAVDSSVEIIAGATAIPTGEIWIRYE